MADAVQFVASSSAPGVYYGQTSMPFLPSSAANVLLVNRKLAWIPRAAPDPPVANLSLTATWAEAPSAYLFLGQSLANEADFAAGVRALLSEPPLQNARFLWLANPNDRRDQWRVSALRIAESGADTLVDAAASFVFGDREVVVAPGCTVALDAQNGLFRVSAGQSHGIFLTSRNGTVSLDVATGDLTISLAGTVPGQLKFPIAFSQGSPALDDFDVALRLYYPENFAGAAITQSLRYPLFDLSKASLSLTARLDPLAPGDASHTSFDFQPGPSVPSFYRTNVGLPVSFNFPAGATGRLVFSARPLFPFATARDPLTLVPDGPLPISAAGNPPGLLCGINGAEFIELDAGSVMIFAAGQPAFLPALPTDDSPPNATGVRLTGQATTSWAAVASGASRLCYSAVPEGAGYYSDPSAPSTLRHYYPACAAFLPELTEQTGASGMYPMLPYSGIQTGDFTSYEHVETQILSPERREQIHRINTGAPIPPPAGQNPLPNAATVTPQGLVAQFSGDRATWTSLNIAQTDAGPLAFQSIVDPLRSALLTNKQFLVISHPSALQSSFASNNVASVDSWTFLLDPAQWSEFGTILIIKNHDHSFDDLVNDISQWTIPGEVNLSPQQAQKSIQASIAAAAGSGNSDFDYFNQTIVNDSRWNGIIFLNVKVSLTVLPPDLEVLAAGIDPSRFFAHHFGLNQTPVTDGSLKVQPTSAFFVIDYEDPSALEPSPADYDLRVASLRVMFENSATSSLSAKAALTLRRFFGAPAIETGGTGTLLLNGGYEKHGDAQAFAFTQAAPAIFTTSDAVLSQVTISKTHCTTTENAPDAAGTVETVFSFWGDLGFHALQLADGTNCDLFSYDHLSFSDLRLTMTYPQSDPMQRAFTFDAGSVTLNAAQSTARTASLASHFPVQIRGLLVSNAADPNAHPVSSGYLSVGLPMDLQPLGSPSYGLEFDLNLGTLGALASSAGFGATFAVAWSPGANSGQIFAGLKLPGLSGGTNQLSLMGVLKMTMFAVELAPDSGAFMLRLNGIALSLLAKTLPPGDTFDFYLVGDPSPHTGAGTLAWYGDFKKNP